MDTASAGATVERDVPCAACGYNLRGLAVDGVCPECAAEVARALCGNPLVDADVGWLARVARGQTLIAWTLLGGFMLTCALLVGGPILQHFGFDAGYVLIPIAYFSIALTLLLLTVGTLYLTSARMTRVPAPERCSRRRIARGLMATLAAGAIVWVALIGLGTWLDIVTQLFARTFLLIAAVAIGVAFLAVPVTISRYVLELLTQVPGLRLPKHFRHVVDHYLLVGISLIVLRVIHGFAGARLLPYYVGNAARWMFMAGLLVLLFYGLRIIELMLVGMRAFRMCRRAAARRQRRLQAVPRGA